MRVLQNWRSGQSAAAFAVSLGIGLSLLNPWEPGGESWGYWYFARVFSETGMFVILERSPLYVLYLNGFRWLGYPASIIVEYLITFFIVVTALIGLFRPYLGLGLAVFASLLWIPFLQWTEPPVQKLALACSCWALMARRTENRRIGKAASYALFGFAYMFRPTFIIFVPLFAAYDVLQVLKQGGVRALLTSMRPKLSHWPIWLVLGLLIWFVFRQSPNAWNNVPFSTNTYLPNPGKIAADYVFIQSFNEKYIYVRYGSPEGRDSYLTNRELFGGASTMMSAIRANPRFIVEQLGRNVKSSIFQAVLLTELLPTVKLRLPSYLSLLALITIFFGAFRASKELSMRLFVIGSILFLISDIVFGPNLRRMHPLIPVLILSASWYGTEARSILAKISRTSKSLFWSVLIGIGLFSLYLIFRIAFAPPGPLMLSVAVTGFVIALVLVAIGRYGSHDTAQRWISLLGCLAVPLALAFLSHGPTRWVYSIKIIMRDVHHGEIRVMEDRPYSMKASFKALEPLVRDCKGVLSLDEGPFIGAFMNVPLDRVYDVLEIPPFGHLGDSVYDGLRPDRIDCVLVSDRLATGVAYGANWQPRYLNYVKPYVGQLQHMGATTYEIQGIGQAIMLPRSK